ncbi:sulfite exporter TauE/SafE family protein [Sulfitobacter sp. LCG007]
MENFFTLMTPLAFAVACGIAVVAGIVKGTVGFAMPMVLISGLTVFLPPEIALAGLILPTVVTNLMQALRQGIGPAWDTVRKFRVFLLCGLVTLLISAQLVRLLSADLLLMLIGVPIVLFALLRLSGRQFEMARQIPLVEAAIGGLAGFIGGLSGVWGPPTVAYLTALGTEKHEHVRTQGVIYGLGAVALVGAHLTSGVLRAQTLPFSMALIVPAVIGMWVGTMILDRIDQRMFGRVTLLVLLLAGLNLVRRGMTG